MIKINPLVLFASLVLSLVGCTKEEPSSTAMNAGTAESATAQVAPAAPVPATQADADLTGNQGRVLSSSNVPGYTYIEVENNGRTIWIAGNPVKVTEGEIINWDQSTVMRNFYSRTLDRTFEEVIFVSRIGTSTSPSVGAMPATLPVTPAPGIEIPKTQVSAQGAVVSVQNAANYTYLEVRTKDNSVVWLAAPETPVNVNDSVSWPRGSLMRNFKSSTLGKTFPEIYFVAAVQVNN